VTTLLVALLVIAVLVGAAVLTYRRRAIEQERRRVASLEAFAEQIRTVSETLPDPVAPREPPPRAPGPLAPAGSRGRTALLDALNDGVERARADGTRLSVALVSSAVPAPALADEVSAVTGTPAYEVGARSVAIVVPGAGRADALGLVARIQAGCDAHGDAVELEPDEDAVALLTRLLAGRRPG
jgi:hypothetical protein